LKDSIGNVTCPILRAYQCPICGATGPQGNILLDMSGNSHFWSRSRREKVVGPGPGGKKL